MGAPFKELDDEAIAEAHKIPKSVVTYLSHHLRNDLAMLFYIAQNLRDEGSVKWAAKLENRIEGIAKDLSALGI